MFNYRIAYLLLVLLFFSCSAEVNFLPDEFFNLSLTKKLTGEEAKEFVNKLHFEPVTETENEIGFYEGEIGSALIYVTHYKNEADAKDYYKQMTEKISPENSVFTGSEYLMLNEKEVYRCFGMGQSHYVFYLGKDLFWISVDTHFGKKYVKQYIEFLGG